MGEVEEKAAGRVTVQYDRWFALGTDLDDRSWLRQLIQRDTEPGEAGEKRTVVGARENSYEESHYDDSGSNSTHGTSHSMTMRAFKHPWKIVTTRPS